MRRWGSWRMRTPGRGKTWRCALVGVVGVAFLGHMIKQLLKHHPQ